LRDSLLALLVCSCLSAACSSSESITGPSKGPENPTITDAAPNDSGTPTPPATPSPAVPEPAVAPTIKLCGPSELQVPVGDGPPHMKQDFLGGGLVQIHATNLTADTICEISYTSWKINNPGRSFLLNEEYLDGALYLLGPGEQKTLGPIRTLETGCTQHDIANSNTLSTRAEDLHAFYFEIRPWERGDCDAPRPPSSPPPPPVVSVTAISLCDTGVTVSANGVVQATLEIDYTDPATPDPVPVLVQFGAAGSQTVDVQDRRSYSWRVRVGTLVVASGQQTACEQTSALVDCLTPGVVTNGVLRNGVVSFTVNVGPVELSLVAFAWNGVTFLPQRFVRGELRTFMPGNHTWAIQPEGPFRQEDLFCGKYPFGEPLTDANFDYWARRTIAGDWGPVK
jgi:hypothetical protein